MQKKTITTDRHAAAAKPINERRKALYTVAMKGIAKGTLLLKVSGLGTKTFYTRALLSTKRIDVRLGNYPILSLKEAVEMHNQMMGYIEKGIDPRPILKAEKQKNIDAITMDELFEQWFEYASTTSTSKQSTLNAHKWRWHDYLSPTIGSVFVKDLNRATLMAAFDKCVARSREQARKAYTTVNLPLDYALARSLINDNPARTIKPKDFNATKGSPKTRILSLEEITELQEVLATLEKSHSPQMLAIVRIALLTAARRGEVCHMKWKDLSYDGNYMVWNLPTTKNGKPHRIYLCSYGRSIIESLKALTGSSEWVFESGKIDNAPIRFDAVTTFVRRLNQKVSFDHFSLHDLRRTAASYWAEKLKADTALIELMLNHLPQNELVRTYQVIQREGEQKEIWMRWDSVVQDTLPNTALPMG